MTEAEPNVTDDWVIHLMVSAQIHAAVEASQCARIHAKPVTYISTSMYDAVIRHMAASGQFSHFKLTGGEPNLITHIEFLGSVMVVLPADRYFAVTRIKL